MIVGGQTEARAQLSSTIIDYHEPFDQGFRILPVIDHILNLGLGTSSQWMLMNGIVIENKQMPFTFLKIS